MFGKIFKDRVDNGDILPLIGIYDVFSAELAATKFEAIFCSGYGFSASHYGLPDEGFLSWTDMVDHVKRIRNVLPEIHMVVDIDDGHGDGKTASHIVRCLEGVGASAVILEDQRRPKRCGHLPGKEILSIEEYLPKLDAVISAREELYVIARTDASNIDEAIMRVNKYAEVGADGVLIEGIYKIRASIKSEVSLTINLIAGGKTPKVSRNNLKNMGVNIVNYSTPCLFAAHEAIDSVLSVLSDDTGLINEKVTLTENNSFLTKKLSDINKSYF